MPQSAPDPPTATAITRRRLRIGVNYPWYKCGWDLGVPPPGWGQRRPWEGELQRDLVHLYDLGVRVLRWFLLANGLTYGSGADAPYRDPRPDSDPSSFWRGEKQWRFNPPPGGAPAIVEDFRLLLDVFAEAHARGIPMQLLPVVIDHQFCFPAQPFAGTGYVARGRSDVIYDPAKSARFIATLLRPLLAAAAERREVIDAIEIINEPEWCTRDDGAWFPSAKQLVPRSRMLDFLRQSAAEIRAHDFRPTVGFADPRTLARWDTRALGLVPQFHYYGQYHDVRRALPPPPEPGTVLGEFGLRIGERAPPWPGLGREQHLLARLRHIETRGYETAFLWSLRGGIRPPDRASDDIHTWDEDIEAGLRAYAAPGRDLPVG